MINGLNSLFSETANSTIVKVSNPRRGQTYPKCLPASFGSPNTPKSTPESLASISCLKLLQATALSGSTHLIAGGTRAEPPPSLLAVAGLVWAITMLPNTTKNRSRSFSEFIIFLCDFRVYIEWTRHRHGAGWSAVQVQRLRGVAKRLFLPIFCKMAEPLNSQAAHCRLCAFLPQQGAPKGPP